MALGGSDALAKPLTRSTKAGQPYARPPAIESRLEELLRATADEQLALAKSTEKDSSRYLPHECIVYLVREAALAYDSERYHTLAAVLLKRVTRGIERKLRALGVAEDDVDDVHQEVVLAMMTAIITPSGEFFQIRFRSALYRQLLKSFDAYARSRRRLKSEQSLDAPAEKREGIDGEDGVTFGQLLESGEDVAADVERRLLIPEALEAIGNPQHRKAFLLHHYHGWQIESTDPNEPTLSELFGRTPKMVRNWLRTADRQLADWRATKRV